MFASLFNFIVWLISRSAVLYQRFICLLLESLAYSAGILILGAVALEMASREWSGAVPPQLLLIKNEAMARLVEYAPDIQKVFLVVAIILAILPISALFEGLSRVIQRGFLRSCNRLRSLKSSLSGKSRHHDLEEAKSALEEILRKPSYEPQVRFRRSHQSNAGE